MQNLKTTTTDITGDSTPIETVKPEGLSEAQAKESSAGKQLEIADPEVKVTKRKRVFSSAYKLRILNELDGCTEPGQKGALLRREGIYSSCINSWRNQRARGALNGLGKVRGRKIKLDANGQRIAELEKQNDGLKKRLKQAESIIEIQKKISETFGAPID